MYTKCNVGRYIIEHEQEGKYKAAYGKQVLKQLSEKLTNRYGKGWSVETLTTTRKFYQTYSNSVNTVYEIPAEANKSEASKIVNTVCDFQDTTPITHKFALSWSHYLILMRISDANARSFYEIECAKQNWSVRWLQRQVNSSLYERLALSKDVSYLS